MLFSPLLLPLTHRCTSPTLAPCAPFASNTLPDHPPPVANRPSPPVRAVLSSPLLTAPSLRSSPLCCVACPLAIHCQLFQTAFKQGVFFFFFFFFCIQIPRIRIRIFLISLSPWLAPRPSSSHVRESTSAPAPADRERAT